MRALPHSDHDPIILDSLYWHQLPAHLQRRYAGQSLMGRIYTLDIGGQVHHVWAEGSIYEEAAWHSSRRLSLRRDREVIDLIRGEPLGEAV